VLATVLYCTRYSQHTVVSQVAPPQVNREMRMSAPDYSTVSTRGLSARQVLEPLYLRLHHLGRPIVPCMLLKFRDIVHNTPKDQEQSSSCNLFPLLNPVIPIAPPARQPHNMIHSVLTLWLLQVFAGPSLAHNNLEQAVAALRLRLSDNAAITFPGESRWDYLQVRASSPRLSPHYTVVVEVATESDVEATVTQASRFDVPFLAVSGRHGWTSTLNRFPYGIQINMRQLNTTTLGREGTSAIVGGGRLQHELTRSLFAEGKYAGIFNFFLYP
jgi:hypothetical protein